MLVSVGEVAALDVADVVTHAVDNLLAQIVIDTQELGFELTVQAQHVVQHKHLAAACPTAADADGGHVDVMDVFL